MCMSSRASLNQWWIRFMNRLSMLVTISLYVLRTCIKQLKEQIIFMYLYYFDKVCIYRLQFACIDINIIVVKMIKKSFIFFYIKVIKIKLKIWFNWIYYCVMCAFKTYIFFILMIFFNKYFKKLNFLMF